MDELNISNLPAEILTKVFRYLNKSNLKNATIVCQLWNNLIQSAFRWSMKLEYDEHDKLYLCNEMNFTLTTNRKFGTISIDGGRLNKDDRIVEIFKRHGFNVVELYLYRFRIDNLTEFTELLRFTPNVKNVIVSMKNSPGSSDPVSSNLLPDLKKLKNLVICVDDYRIIKCFRKAKLTAITISEPHPTKNRSLMVDFLSTQDELTSLTINRSLFSSSILFEMGKLNVPIPFRLTQLSMSGIFCQNPSQDYDYFMRFIESQAGNLIEIEMNRNHESFVYECVFANMTKLNTLWVEIYELPQDNDFYDRLTENRNVHTVRLLDNDITLDVQFVGKFLQKLPNVRCLILMKTQDFVNKSISVMAQSLNKLEFLYIDLIDGSSLDCVKFPNLKALHIQYLCGKMNWNEFTKSHPMLTELTIVEMDHESFLTSDDIDQITTNVDLQHIRLGGSFVADNRFFEIIGSKCKNLKVLDLHKSCISQNLRHNMKIDVLRLRDRILCSKVFRLKLFG